MPSLVEPLVAAEPSVRYQAELANSKKVKVSEPESVWVRVNWPDEPMLVWVCAKLAVPVSLKLMLWRPSTTPVQPSWLTTVWFSSVEIWLRVNVVRPLSSRRRVALEFRHDCWFDEEVFTLLRQKRVALGIADAEGDLEVPFVATAAWGYLRLRRPAYSTAALKAWAKRLRQQDWQDAFVFFKHEEEGQGAKLAQQFLKLAD